MNTQIIRSFLRKAGILPVIDSLRYYFIRLRNNKKNSFFLKEHPSFKPPPSKAAYDAYTTIDHSSYFNSGKREAEIISEFVERFSEGKKVLDFGCGSARILRHLDSKKYSLTGSDYNKEAIEWCKVNLPDIKFISNALLPPLDLKSDTFNFAYAISVFTHLSEEVQIQWLKELERVTANNGHIMITLHGERHASKLTMEELLKFKKGEAVIRGNVKEGSRIFTSYHSPKYAKENLFKDKEIVYFSDEPLHKDFTQDVYIIKVKK